MSATVKINGITYVGRSSVVVRGGRVIIDGEDLTPDGKVINIVVEGSVEKLEADACQKVMVAGNAGSIQTASGDVEISGDVGGNVETVSGDVRCGSIAGSVRTVSGDIKRR